MIALPSECAVIALGANEGESDKTVRAAMERLRALSPQPILRSSLYQTTPIDCPPGSALFINAAVALIPPAGQTPEQLLNEMRDIERAFGRVRDGRFHAPRTLDLDLIFFARCERRGTDLELPHPRWFQRGFVLQPLSDLFPDYVAPGQTRSVGELLADLGEIEGVVPLDD